MADRPVPSLDAASGADNDPPLPPPAAPLHQPVTDPERLRQRAVFLRELEQARALVTRAVPMRTRAARLRARLRQR